MCHVARRCALVVTLSLVAVACRDENIPTTPTFSPSSPDLAAGPIVENRSDAADPSLKDRYIVIFRDDVTDPSGRARGLARAHGGALRFIFTSAVHGFSGHFTPGAIAAIRKSPDVKYVEPLTGMSPLGSGTASAPYHNLDLIDQSTLARDYSYSWDQDGTGVTAYVLDAGLSAGLAEFGGRAQVVADFTDNGGGWGVDCANHGTSVAAILGGANYGVARNVQLRAVRVLGCAGLSPTDWFIAGMDWVNAHGVKPAVVNMSVSGPRSTAVNDAVQRLENNGFRTVAGAGNNNGNAINYSPASANTTFTVGNAYYDGATLVRYTDSNYGPWVSIWAPGQNSTSISNTGVSNAFGGTSAATPHVAGWTAIYLSSDPSMPKYSLSRYAIATSKMTISNTSGSLGKFLYTRLQFVSWINEANTSVPAGYFQAYTSSQFQGSAPYTFVWKQNGTPVCGNSASCTVYAPGTPGYSDVITLTTTDALGRVWEDYQYLNATCQDGGYSC